MASCHIVDHRDFIQDYLLARAVLYDIDPYLPLPELVTRLLGPLHKSVLTSYYRVVSVRDDLHSCIGPFAFTHV